MNFYDLWMLCEAKVPSIVMYHGTTDKILQTILTQGLVPNPKQRSWSDDPNVGWSQPSRVSLEGIYLTRNVLTASGSARRTIQKLGGKHPIIVICKVQPRSLVADEDDFTHRAGDLNLPGQMTGELNSWQLYCCVERLQTNDYQVPKDYKYDPEEYKEYKRSEDEKWVKQCRESYIERSLQSINWLLKTEESKELHPKLLARLKEVLAQGFIAVLRRFVAHGAKNLDTWNRRRDGGDIQPPDVASAEHDFKMFQNQLTHTLKGIAARENSLQGTARCLEPIAYSGANKIICVVEIIRGEEIGHPDWYDCLHPVYGTLPDEFLKDWQQRSGDPHIV